MSKSAQSPANYVGLLDEPAVARKKIMRAVTDTQPAVDFDNLGPGVANLLGIFQAFSEWTDDRMRSHFHGKRYGDLKKEVAEMTLAHLEPFQQRFKEITADKSYVAGVLRSGAERVSVVANDTVRTVKQRMGLYTE